jgi:hypothetical protein
MLAVVAAWLFWEWFFFVFPLLIVQRSFPYPDGVGH